MREQEAVAETAHGIVPIELRKLKRLIELKKERKRSLKKIR